MSLIPQSWLDEQMAKRKAAIKQEKAERPKGQKCSNCNHHTEHPFSPRYHYCSLGRSPHTPNGFAKTKAGGWCQKWKEIRDSKGHWIAIYSPQWSHAEDMRKRRETSVEVARWTVQWFKERGHDVEAEIMADGQSIGIRKANSFIDRPVGNDGDNRP